jgi:anti-sigma factor RsiW
MNGQEQDNLEFELSQYLDGQLSGRRARQLERRLEQDPALRETLQRYAALDGRLVALGGAGLAGVDYDSQRAEVVRRLERRALLERRPARIIFLRPVFAMAGGGLAVAAAVLIAVLVWRGGQPPVSTPTVSEVSVAVLAPVVPRGGEAQVTLRRLEDREIRLADAEEGPHAPPGTVMVSINPPPPDAWGAGAFPFSVE